jgi:hypothetical protein
MPLFRRYLCLKRPFPLLKLGGYDEYFVSHNSIHRQACACAKDLLSILRVRVADVATFKAIKHFIGSY